MTFSEATTETVRMAKKKQQLFYPYKGKSGKYLWRVSVNYWDDWLFKAYPGGRMEMSKLGKELAGITEQPKE